MIQFKIVLSERHKYFVVVHETCNNVQAIKTATFVCRVCDKNAALESLLSDVYYRLQQVKWQIHAVPKKEATKLMIFTILSRAESAANSP